MSELDQKTTDDKDQPATPPRRAAAEQPVPHAPGGPGWFSEHSLLLWIVGTVIAVSILVVYMIIDNT